MRTFTKVLIFSVSILATFRLVGAAFSGMSAPSEVGFYGGILLLVALATVWGVFGYRFVQRLISTHHGRHQLVVAMILVLGSAGAGCTRVGPGYVGIEIDLAGSQRGVQDLGLSTGWIFYNPFGTQVVEYPTFVQTAVWTKEETDGSPNNEETLFNSQEGMVIAVDLSLSYHLEEDKVPAFYVMFRTDDLDRFTHGFLRNVARDAFNEIAPKYKVDEIYGPKKEELLSEVKTRINSQVGNYGVTIEQFGVVGEMRLPSQVVDALNNKIKATQDAQRAENELREAEANAKKRVATAEGEAEANRRLTASLSSTLLEWKRLEIMARQTEVSNNAVGRWNGQLPTYSMGGAVPMIQLPVPSSTLSSEK